MMEGKATGAVGELQFVHEQKREQVITKWEYKPRRSRCKVTNFTKPKKKRK